MDNTQPDPATLFPEIGIFHDLQPRSAALNMALDDALLQLATDRGVALLRWYQWERPAVSIGYFQEAAPVQARHPQRDFVRRRTGGGTVLHGPAAADGFTVTLAVPAGVARATGLANLSESYCRIHKALAAGLREVGVPARMVTCSAHDGARSGDCFVEPVSGDVELPDGRKIAGAAQSRSRGSLLHQQIVQLPVGEYAVEEIEIVRQFTRHLTAKAVHLDPQEIRQIEEAAPPVAEKNYATPEWNDKR